MKNFSFEVRPDGVAIAQFDVPGRSMNTITFDVQDDLAELARRLSTDEQIVGLVLSSGKSSGFCAGADLVEMEGAIEQWRRATTQDELRAGVESAGRYSQRLRSLETAGKPIAVIVTGVALGGGLELALAGHHRVTTGDRAKLRMGLPEVTIGLMPGAGATQRLPHLMGLERSVAYLIDGAPIGLDAALQSGIVHQHLEHPSDAFEAAVAWVLANREAVQPWDIKGYRFPDGIHTPAGYAKFPFFIARAVGDGPGDHAARGNILRAIYEGAMVPVDAGLRIESRYFFNTVRTPSSGTMVRSLFTARQSLAKADKRDVAPYVERIREAWRASIDALVARGESRRFVLGVSRSLSPAFTPNEAGSGPISIHPSDDVHIEGIVAHILGASAHEAAACWKDNLVISREEADLRAIEAGYPAFTGGPISYLEAGSEAKRREFERRMDDVVSDGDLAILIHEMRLESHAETTR
jgi:3-hydroxyacyl-CoA dehydrogenase/enoyl-CoA hydratase/3-hydroxybutyryl-CoA epimerase